MKKIALILILILPKMTIASDFRTNNQVPAINYNPEPQDNFIDAMMNGYERGQRMKMMNQQIELTNQQIRSNQMSMENNNSASNSSDRDICISFSKKGNKLLMRMAKEDLVVLFKSCVDVLK